MFYLYGSVRMFALIGHNTSQRFLHNLRSGPPPGKTGQLALRQVIVSALFFSLSLSLSLSLSRFSPRGKKKVNALSQFSFCKAQQTQKHTVHSAIL